MNRKIQLTDATADQCREFANNTLGLNLPVNTKPETVRAKIAASWDKDFIMVEPEAKVDKQEGAAPTPVTAEQAEVKPKMVRIHINVTEESGGNEDVPVGVNGKVMLIPRGKDVDIPEPYFLVLQNAIAHKWDALPGGGMAPEPRKVPMYPFQVISQAA